MFTTIGGERRRRKLGVGLSVALAVKIIRGAEDLASLLAKAQD